MLITDENVQEPHAQRVAESLAGRVDRGRHGGGRAGRAEQVDRVAAAGSGRDCSTWAPTARRSSWPSAAAWWATWPGSSPPPTPGASASSRCPPRCWPRSTAPWAARSGINLPEAKNMVGAFLQPMGVLIDTATLATLDRSRVPRRAGRGGQVRRDPRRRAVRLPRSPRRPLWSTATATCSAA